MLRELQCPVFITQESELYFVDHQLFVEMSLILASIHCVLLHLWAFMVNAYVLSSTDFSSSTVDCEHSSDLRLQFLLSLHLLRFHPFQ